MFAQIGLLMNILTKLFELFKIFKTIKGNSPTNTVTNAQVEQAVKTADTIIETVKETVTEKPESKPEEQKTEQTETIIEEPIMTPSNKCYDLIKSYEGFSAKPYKCPAGVATIGYGSTFYEDGTKVKMTDAPINEARGLALLASVVTDFSKQVNKLIKVEVNQNQYDALVDFAYNVGVANLGSSTLLKKLNSKLYTEAAEQFPRWNKANGVVLSGLTKRRNSEKELFLS